VVAAAYLGQGNPAAIPDGYDGGFEKRVRPGVAFPAGQHAQDTPEGLDPAFTPSTTGCARAAAQNRPSDAEQGAPRTWAPGDAPLLDAACFRIPNIHAGRMEKSYLLNKSNSF
jgi:hypothetical protein